MVGKSTTYKYHEHIGEVAETLAPHYIISIGVWFPEKTMEVSSTKPMSNKYIDQYSESTLTAVFKCKGFETQGLLPEMEAASISLSPYNNMLIPLILQILVNIYYYIIHKNILITFLETLVIPYYMVPPGWHSSILCQIQNRFFNKIQLLHAIYFPTYKQWILGILFVIYAWNASPRDVMDHNCMFFLKLDAYSYSHLISCKTCHKN